MGSTESGRPLHGSDDMFTILSHAVNNGLGPRLGRLTLRKRRTIETPHYLAITSRGAVPHLSPDNFTSDANISGVYVGLEDFIEKAPQETPPLYQFHPSGGSSPLRQFIGLPEEALCVLGARRTPPVAAPAANPNTNTTVSVCTAVGFRLLQADDYADAAEKINPDIVVGLGDVPYGRALGSKRIEKATDRTIEWMRGHVKWRTVSNPGSTSARLFAPLLPVTCANQQYYIDYLTQDARSDISGLAVYNLSSLADLPEALAPLPRLAFTTPGTPHEVLRQISLGVDVLTLPFITAATDAGIALSFSFSDTKDVVADTSRQIVPLGIDMWLPSHATDLSPLTEACECYACITHHRAYVQHLLVAKEMLGWVLLQIHNHHTIDRFFSAIRRSIAKGTFERDCGHFGRTYESLLPEKTGLGPRVRGYHFKSEGPGEVKRNQSPFNLLNGENKKPANSTPASLDSDDTELESNGFAKKVE